MSDTNKTIYTINYLRTVQVGPDDWESYTATMELTDETTVFDIKLFVSQETGYPLEKVSLVGMKIGKLIRKG